MKTQLFSLILILCAAILSADGALDPSFGEEGKVVTEMGSNWDEAISMVLQSDGKIIVGGGIQSDFSLARYTTHGKLDINFGNNGKIYTDFGGLDTLADIALQSNGKIVAVGQSGSDNYLALARYNRDGSIDKTFGIYTNGMLGDGKIIMDMGVIISRMAIQQDDKIIIAGTYRENGNDNFALVRYDSNGSLDSTFGVNGRVTTDLGGADSAFDIAIQDDGKIVVVGSSWNGSYHTFALARYNTNGTLDTTFNGGIITTDIDGYSAQAFSVAIADDGKIIAAGSGYRYIDFALVRYTKDGEIDPSFGNEGMVDTDMGTYHDVIKAIAIDKNGKIIVAGRDNKGSVALARYTSNGLLDSSFGAEGKVFTDFGGNYDRAKAIVIQDDGNIVIAGGSEGTSLNNFNFILARYLSSSTSNDQPSEATAPAQFTTSSGDYNDRVKLSWSKVDAAYYYTLFRSDSKESVGELLLQTKDNTQLSFSDTTVIPGKTYYYRIGSCGSNYCSMLSEPKQGFAYYNTADTFENEIALQLQDKTFAIAYFFHFGDDAFDWMYVQPGGAIVAKLEGMNSSGYLQWKVFQNAKSTSFTSVDTYTIQLDNTVSTSVVFGNYIGTDTKTHDIGLLLSGKTENVDGYFARYGVGAYDWIYVSADRKMIAKLEGIDPATNYFIWTMLQQGSTKLFTSVDIIDGGEKIEFGSLKK